MEFQALVDQLSGLAAGQREALLEAVRAKASASDAVSLIDRRFAAAPRCPHSPWRSARGRSPSR